ncbi:hypothetical protein IKF34_00430 [Candidatus Saccharibacteria bacterium]|nr:hypothetical protein [Candidatus Saccharibacteria bacterium]
MFYTQTYPFTVQFRFWFVGLPLLLLAAVMIGVSRWSLSYKDKLVYKYDERTFEKVSLAAAIVAAIWIFLESLGDFAQVIDEYSKGAAGAFALFIAPGLIGIVAAAYGVLFYGTCKIAAWAAFGRLAEIGKASREAREEKEIEIQQCIEEDLQQEMVKEGLTEYL